MAAALPLARTALGDGPPLSEAFSDAQVTKDGKTLELADVRKAGLA